MELLSDKLLGRIFSYLDFRSLMAADMVCKRWQNVINKQHLYLKISKRESPPGLNDDCLEKIFTNLSFRSLIVAEMVCKQWKNVICDRRLFWQLSKHICRASKRKLPKSFRFEISNLRSNSKKITQRNTGAWPSKRKKVL